MEYSCKDWKRALELQTGLPEDRRQRAAALAAHAIFRLHQRFKYGASLFTRLRRDFALTFNIRLILRLERLDLFRRR